MYKTLILKPLVHNIRFQKNWENFIVKVATPQSPLNIPTASISSSSSSNLHLINIDTLEIARQLTIMESSLYLKIKPMECFQRSRQVTVDYTDSISLINRYSDQVGLLNMEPCLLDLTLTVLGHFVGSGFHPVEGFTHATYSDTLLHRCSGSGYSVVRQGTTIYLYRAPIGMSVPSELLKHGCHHNGPQRRPCSAT
jgi:hypothetical protein